MKALNTKQIVLILAAVVAVGVLFVLPKGVVKKEAENSGKPAAEPTSVAATPSESKDANSDTLHKVELSPTVIKQITELKTSASKGNNTEKGKALLALADLFKANTKYDSAAAYLEQRAGLLQTGSAFELAGETYYEAYSLAFDEAKRQGLLSKSQELLTKAFDLSKSLSAKTKLALTYVESPSPMKGIGLLREVLAVEPKNELALYSLGTLSIRSQQYDKALARFEQLIAINPSDSRYYFYQAECLAALKKPTEAITAYKKASELNTDPTAKATIADRIADLQGN
ncbi:MAG: tetratricopeptide repeat protein [Flexibacteraceae bacterium]